MCKRTYQLTLCLTADEAESLVREAGASGLDVGSFLTRLAEDIHSGAGDEGELLEAYLERRRGPWSFVGFCHSWGYDVGILGALCESIHDKEEQIAMMQEAVAKRAFPEDDGWLPSATKESVLEEIEDYQHYLAEDRKEKEALWKEYLKAGGDMSEEEALEEERAWNTKASSFLEQ